MRWWVWGWMGIAQPGLKLQWDVWYPWKGRLGLCSCCCWWRCDGNGDGDGEVPLGARESSCLQFNHWVSCEECFNVMDEFELRKMYSCICCLVALFGCEMVSYVDPQGMIAFLWWGEWCGGSCGVGWQREERGRKRYSASERVILKRVLRVFCSQHRIRRCSTGVEWRGRVTHSTC